MSIARRACAATRTSCVITTIVKPAAFSWSSSSISAAAFRESRLPVGSSHSSRLGRFTSARAIATRWHSPPDSVVGSASSRCAQPDRVQRPDRRPDPAAARRLVVQLGQQHVLQRRPVRQQVERLEDEADPPAAQRGPVPVAQRAGVQAVQQVAALGRRVEQAEQVQQRRLARAGRPGHRDVVARLDDQVGRAQRGHRRRSRVGAGQAAQLDHRAGGAISRSPPRGRRPRARRRSPGSPGRSRSRRCPASPRTCVLLPVRAHHGDVLVPDAVVTMAATGTVSTGPSVCPVSTVTRTFSPFSAEASGLDGCTVSGMNAVALEPPEPEDPEDPDDPDDAARSPEDPADPERRTPKSPPSPSRPRWPRSRPAGTVVVGVPRSATVPGRVDAGHLVVDRHLQAGPDLTGVGAAAARRSAPATRARRARGTAGRAARRPRRSPRPPSRAATAGTPRPPLARRPRTAGCSRGARSTGSPRTRSPGRSTRPCHRRRSSRARPAPAAARPRPARSRPASGPARRAPCRSARTAARRRSRRAARRWRTVPPAATSSFEMYTVPRPRRSGSEEGCPAGRTRAEPRDGALGYTSYSVAGYTTPRIWTDEVRTWETTAAVVTVAGGAAVSAASCCGDFTNEAPISPPTASRAAAMPTPSSTRRRRASRDPRTACRRPRSPGPLSVAGGPS